MSTTDDLPERGGPIAPVLHFYPYQQRWLKDTGRFKIGMFARQTGKTFTTCGELVDDCIQGEIAGRKVRWVILSRGERQAAEAMEEAIKPITKAFYGAYNTLLTGGEPEYRESEFRAPQARGAAAVYKALEVRFPGGSRVTALPANPDTARGFSANVVLDEFAFHANSRAIWSALFPVISKGDQKLRVISTPNGKGNKFYELMTGEDGIWSRHHVDIHQAVAQGYDNWDRIVRFLLEKVDVVRAAFDEGLLNGVFKLIAEFNPWRLAIEGLQGLIAYVMDLLGVPQQIVEAFRAFDLFETGANLLKGLWDGMASLVPQMVAAIGATLSGIVPDWMRDAWNWVSGKSGAATEGGRDRGGPVRAGLPYLVGERSPEIFVPGVSGTILPGRALKAALAASALAAPVAAAPVMIDHRPVIAAPAPASAPQIIREGDVITIHIHPAQGMSAEDIGREVERCLARRQDARRADLHDGVDYQW